MSDEPVMEACRTEEDLRAAYATQMAKQVAAGPESLAMLRARFRKRSRELREGLGSSIEGRAAWILACLESSLPDAFLEAELLRLHAEDPKLDLARLREILAAREEWKEARADPDIPPVVLQVLLRRLGVPPRARAVAQDVARPRDVTERIERAYPRLLTLDRAMFQRIKGLPASTGRGALPGELPLNRKRTGRRSFWIVVLAIWAVAQLLSLAAKAMKSDEPRGAPKPKIERSEYGAEYDRVNRRLEEVKRLAAAVRAVEDEVRTTRTITVPQRQRLRELIQDIRVSVSELSLAAVAVDQDTGYPRLDDLAQLETSCERAASRLDARLTQLRMDGAR